MRVSRIEFEGYRRLAETATGIDGPLTAFVGFNEAGKTTVLRGLRWFTSGGEISPVDYNRSRPPASDQSAVVKVFYALDSEDKEFFADIAMDNPPATLVLYRKRDGSRIRDLNPRPTRPAKAFQLARERLIETTTALAASDVYAEVLSRLPEEPPILDEGYSAWRDEYSALYEPLFKERHPELADERDALLQERRLRDRQVYEEPTVLDAQKLIVAKCGIEVPDGYEFKTPEELGVSDRFRE